jgi:geranylgeranyl diphosphate synthase type 3
LCYELGIGLNVTILYCRTDDIQDNAILRRGIPAAHSIYGVASTINVSNYLLIKALRRVQSLNHPDAIAVCTEQLLEWLHATALENSWSDNCTCPSFEEYKQMLTRSKDRTEP